MMFFLLGIGALILGLLGLNAFMRANPVVLARQLRVVAGGAALAGAVVLSTRGMFGIALSLGMFGYWMLFGARIPSWGSWPGSGPARGQFSRVVTETLEMELDHDSGEMRGRILKGAFADRAIEQLTPAELALLWRECRFHDPKAAALIEAYLDRGHPTWREDMSRDEGARAEAPAATSGPMTREEAFDILGLQPGASDDEIRKAHRDLMMKLHPDRGGSGYLAAKINEAKDLLTGK